MTTNNIDRELSPSNELRDGELEHELDQVTGGVTIVKMVDKASPAILSTMGMGGGTPSLEYWLQQLMF